MDAAPERDQVEQDLQQQKAEDNERLRRLAAAELASMRVELTAALNDRVELHRDLNALAERLSQQEDLTIAARHETAGVREELAAVQAELASTKQDLATSERTLAASRAEVTARNATITELRRKPPKLWTRVVPRPVKQAVKKALGRETTR